MRNLLIAAVGAVTLSSLVACSETSTEPAAPTGAWFSSNTEVFDENPIPDSWNDSRFGETAPGQSASNYCSFYGAMFGETWEVGEKWESPDEGEDADPLPSAGGFEFTLWEDGKHLDWDGTETENRMRLVVLKAGGGQPGTYDHHLYFYNGRFPNEAEPGTAPAWDEDEGLYAPDNQGGNRPTISHFAYCYVAGDNGNGYEGCTIGYWMNHDGTQRSGRGPARWSPDSWQYTEYETKTKLHHVFEIGEAYDIHADDTFRMAIEYRGGPTLTDAAQLLLRQAVAALLSATYDNDGVTLNYEWSAGDIIDAVDAALASEDRQTVLDLAGTLDEMNNAGCPL